MFCQAGFDQWLTTIMHHLSPLSKPQATVLALWSFGMVLARSCSLAAGVAALAAPAGTCNSPRLDSDRAGRSRLVCAVAVSAHRPAGLASVFAHQHRR